MSHCTECGEEMPDSEARLFEECFRCRLATGKSHPIPRFAATNPWKRNFHYSKAVTMAARLCRSPKAP